MKPFTLTLSRPTGGCEWMLEIRQPSPRLAIKAARDMVRRDMAALGVSEAILSDSSNDVVAILRLEHAEPVVKITFVAEGVDAHG